MSYINWGSESPEQLAIRRQLEQQALYEQAVRVSQARAGNAPGAVGGGSISQYPPSTIGETVLYHFEANTGELILGFIDFPINKFSAVYPTGLLAADWYVDNIYVTHNKGYVAHYKKYTDNSLNTLFFFTAGGKLIDTLNQSNMVPTVDLSVDAVRGEYVLLIDYDAHTAWVFDGETLVTDTTTFVDQIMVWDYDNNLDGFYVKSYDQLGFFHIYRYNGSGFVDIAALDTEFNAFVYVVNTYENSNVIRVGKYETTPESYYHEIQYINKNGTVLHTVDVLSENANDWLSSDCWGSGKHVDTFVGDINYRHIFFDSTNLTSALIDWTVDRTDFNGFEVTKNPVSPTNISDTKNENALMTWISIAVYDKNMVITPYLQMLPIFGTPPADPSADYYILNDTGDISVAYGQTHVYVADSIFVPKASDLLNVDPSVPQLEVIRFASNGTIDYHSIRAWEDVNLINSQNNGYGPGTRYWLNVSDVLNDNAGDVHIFETDGTTIGFAVPDFSNLSYEWDRNTLAWCDYTRPDNQAFYVNDSVSVANPGVIEPWSDSNFPNAYKTVDQMFPGNVVLQTGTKSRLWLFNDVGNNEIEDGGEDMYDGGNTLTTNNSGSVSYTHTQMTEPSPDASDEAQLSDFIMDGTVQPDGYGGGSSYFTNLYPGMFVMAAKNVDLTSVGISGNSGADSNGYIYSNSIQITVGGTDYTAFIKCNTNNSSDDPTTNQIIIVDSQSVELIQTVPTDTNDDAHTVEWTTPSIVTEAHILVLATYNRSTSIRISDIQLADIVSTYLTLVEGKSIENILTDLNANYEDITSIVNGVEKYQLRVITGTTNIAKETPYYWNLSIGANTIIGHRYNDDNVSISFDVYDLALNLLGSSTVTAEGYDTLINVDQRICAIAQTFNERTGIIWTGTKFVKYVFPEINNGINYYTNDIVNWND
jgi:hypothetical protein